MDATTRTEEEEYPGGTLHRERERSRIIYAHTHTHTGHMLDELYTYSTLVSNVIPLSLNIFSLTAFAL